MKQYDVAWIRNGQNLTYINADIEELVGFTVDEILALPDGHLVTPGSHEKLQTECDAGPPDSIEVHSLPIHLRCKDGREICCRIVAVCRYGTDGKLAEAWGTIQCCQEQYALNRLLDWWPRAEPMDLTSLNRLISACA